MLDQQRLRTMPDASPPSSAAHDEDAGRFDLSSNSERATALWRGFRVGLAALGLLCDACAGLLIVIGAWFGGTRGLAAIVIGAYLSWLSLGALRWQLGSTSAPPTMLIVTTAGLEFHLARTNAPVRLSWVDLVETAFLVRCSGESLVPPGCMWRLSLRSRRPLRRMLLLERPVVPRTYLSDAAFEAILHHVGRSAVVARPMSAVEFGSHSSGYAFEARGPA